MGEWPSWPCLCSTNTKTHPRCPEQISAGLGPHVIYPSCTPHPPARQFPRDERSRVAGGAGIWHGTSRDFPPALQLPISFRFGRHRVSAVWSARCHPRRSTPKDERGRSALRSLTRHHSSPITHRPSLSGIKIDENMLYEEKGLKIGVVA